MRALICDDNRKVLKELETLIKDSPSGKDIDIEIFVTCADVLQELAASDLPTQAVFIDVVFETEDGIETANTIRRLYPDVNIVFITGHVEYAPCMFDAQPIYMLQKPFQKDKLEAALREIKDRVEKNENGKITFKNREAWQTVNYSDIEYIESEQRMVHVYGTFGKITSYGRLSKLFNQLPEYFGRCHQSYVVNMRRIDLMTTTDVHLISGAVLPISQRRRSEFRDTYVAFVDRQQAF